MHSKTNRIYGVSLSLPFTAALDRSRFQWTNTELVNKRVLLPRTELFKAASIITMGKKKEKSIQRRKKGRKHGR
jgi:hypothetical protein